MTNTYTLRGFVENTPEINNEKTLKRADEIIEFENTLTEEEKNLADMGCEDYLHQSYDESIMQLLLSDNDIKKAFAELIQLGIEKNKK